MGTWALLVVVAGLLLYAAYELLPRSSIGAGAGAIGARRRIQVSPRGALLPSVRAPAVPREAPDCAVPRPALVALAVTSCLAAVYFSWDIGSWQVSFVGDEWAFYAFARDIATRHLLVNPFDPNGVYGSNAVMGSFYQAIFLVILGPSNVAWRLSNTILIIPMSIVFFLWLRLWFGWYAALGATIILQSSFYLANFFKIGYTNPQAVLCLIVCLYAASLCYVAPTARHMVFLGLALGLSFYIYIGPLYPFIVWPYVVALLRRDSLSRVVRTLSLALVMYGIIVLPGIVNATHVGAAAGKTVFHPEFTDRLQILVNVLNGFLVFFQSGPSDHFVTDPCLDLVTRILALAGIVITFLRIRRQGYLLLVASYASAVVMIYATSPYAYVPTTRTICVVPFGAAFAGVALGALPRLRRWYVLVPVLAAIFALNANLSQASIAQAIGYNPTAEIIHALQQSQAGGSKHATILLLSDQNGFNYQNVLLMRQPYHLDAVPFTVLTVSELRCPAITHGTVLVLQNDAGAQAAIRGMQCPGGFATRQL